MTKRSKAVALSILGAASFALAGCQEEKIDAQAYPDVETCKAEVGAGGLASTEQCDIAFAEAQALHVEAAPRYDSIEVCESQHGAGACGSEASQVASGGSGGIFMPLLTGYLIGNMLGGRGGMAGSQPLYRKSGGGFTNAAGSASYSANKGKASIGSNQFAKPAATAGKAPMTKATVGSRGGFGKTGGTRGFGG
ncbi:DUF1190 domain-containing protein [Pacificibacter marinus]|uniref:DUF1190 domain-containing protein n=1 Tax=Pacificibacter marinus TaxID=658057 RepID=A0A1Y5RR46_9RHOB|nr:DUF1190 domain-containing protein [Pacificibacter marinus]SEL31298.1 Uncharacterized conserved protein YgiB, involved in bioifilm formation, UPF0441/DUF1190 family [Pacificibacter marinus]SLN22407.1 hypothetical protein PAM7971_00677 [Pacificibacter marinus]